MLKTGRFNTLKIDAIDAQGAWLRAPQTRLLLPRAELPEGAAVGDRLEVFVYRDGNGLPMATLRRPLAQVGEFAWLKVSQVTKIGAFLDWGLPKELLVPFSEQPERMRAGKSYLVRVCLDDRDRIVATARIDACLEAADSALEPGTEVSLLIWEFTDLGAKVIIDNLYVGLLYQEEIRPGMKRGQRFSGYVKKLRDDGKIDVTLRKGGREDTALASEMLLAALARQGFVPLHDQSPPEAIRAALGMSKKTFKKAVGALYKAGRITLEEGGIRLKTPAG